MEYLHFKDPKQREEIIEISTKLADYLRNNSIDTIFFLDRSARLGYIGLRACYQQKYKNKLNIYFINPNGLFSTKTPRQKRRSEEELIKEFKEKYKIPLESRLMLFDNCMHTGKTMNRVKRIIERAGYTQIQVGLAQPIQDYNEHIDYKVDFRALEKRAYSSCKIYGDTGTGVIKVLDSITSKRYKTPNQRAVRKELFHLFKKVTHPPQQDPQHL